MLKNKKNIKKRIKIRTILLLIITFASNTFAWFIYNTKVDNSISTSVKAWRIAFENNDNEAIQYLEFKIDNIYPGMTDYSNYITVTNEGETDAKIVYEIQELKILEDTYDNTKYTQDELNKMISSDFPFKINFNIDTEELKATSGSGIFTVNVSWPYESGNDELDTIWGNKSYTYKQNYPNTPGIVIRIKLTVSQIKNS